MPKQVYRIGQDIYDAATGQKIANPQVLSTQYAGATEVGAPGSTPSTTTSNSTPTVARPGAYGLSDWRSYQSLKDAANQIISMKNKGNQDLTESGSYWKGLIKDTSPFGGTTDTTQVGKFTDERLRQLSPSDQASVRAAREAAASGALAANETERQYREKTTGTALQNIADITEQQRLAKSDEEDANYKKEMLKLERYKEGLGNYYVDNSGNIQQVDDTKQFKIDGTVYDLSQYAEDEKWGGTVKSILSKVPKYEEYDNTGRSSQFQTSFDKYLADKKPNSTLIGQGQNIYAAAKEYGISPELLFSIIATESTWGTSNVAKNNNNLGGVTWSQSYQNAHPEVSKGSARPAREGGYYVKFPTVMDSIDSIASIVKGTIRGDNLSFGAKKNSYSQDELKSASLAIGVPVVDLKGWTDQEIIDAKRDVSGDNTGPVERLLNQTDGLRLQAQNPKFTTQEIQTLMNAYNTYASTNPDKFTQMLDIVKQSKGLNDAEIKKLRNGILLLSTGE